MAFEFFGMKFFEDQNASRDIVNPLDYSVTLKAPGAPDALVQQLKDASSLVADQGQPVSGTIGLMSKARNDREQLVAALYENARYDGVVTIAIAGQALDTLPPDTTFPSGKPVPVTITVDPGQVFRLGTISLTGDTAGIDPARFGLVRGGDASSTNVLDAEQQIRDKLKAEGRPLARVSERKVVANHDTATLDVALKLSAGPVAPFGKVSVNGAESVDPDFVAHMTGIEKGERYAPQALKDARDNLLGLDVFNSVSVKTADALAPDGTIPVTVTVSERKPRFLGIGATLSNTEGLGVEGYWGHRNLFGHAESLRLDGKVGGVGRTLEPGRLDYSAAIVFGKPGIFGPSSKFTGSLKTAFEHPDAYDRFTVGGSVGLTRKLDKRQTVSGEFDLDWSRIEDSFGLTKHLLASVPLRYIYDARDNTLDPTTGFRVAAFGQPAYDILTGATFAKMSVEGSVYHALDDKAHYVAAARAKIGTIVGAGLADIPADQRFYAGGGGSVRGYAYQGIGPKDASGTPTGGRSLFEASAELRVKVTDTIGVVPFVDAGTVSAAQTPDFGKLRFGAGLGLRYDTAFGPLRVDVAVPLNREPGDPNYGIYAGIGQSF